MDMNKLMQQAQQMQKKMAQVQEELAKERVEAESGGGAVKVVFSGKQELVELHIDPSVVVAEETDLLEDLLLAALQEGQRRAARLAEEQMGRLTGGLGGLGGLL